MNTDQKIGICLFALLLVLGCRSSALSTSDANQWGTWGGAEGVDERVWPQRMEIDYIRVYQH
jgi:hypothetical protein